MVFNQTGFSTDPLGVEKGLKAKAWLGSIYENMPILPTFYNFRWEKKSTFLMVWYRRTDIMHVICDAYIVMMTNDTAALKRPEGIHQYMQCSP
jgi:hypothetical protein